MHRLYAPIYGGYSDFVLLYNGVSLIILFVMYMLLDSIIIAHSRDISNVINAGTWVVSNGCKP